MLVDSEIRRLQAHWETYWPDADHVAMGKDVHKRLTKACADWAIPEVRFLRGGVVALVCSGGGGVIKVQPRGHGEEEALRAQTVALAHWGAAGLSPTVFSRRDDGLTVLMERVMPGETLDTVLPPVPHDERLRLIGGLVRRLHEVKPPSEGIPRIGEVVPFWRDTLAPMSEARAELDELLAPSVHDVLVHGDLHGGNVLRHVEGWRVIDPHATLADRHCDVWALIDPSCTVLPPEDIGRRLGVYAEAADLDPKRAARWVKLRATIEARDIRTATVLSPVDDVWASWLEAVAAAL